MFSTVNLAFLVLTDLNEFEDLTLLTESSNSWSSLACSLSNNAIALFVSELSPLPPFSPVFFVESIYPSSFSSFKLCSCCSSSTMFLSSTISKSSILGIIEPKKLVVIQKYLEITYFWCLAFFSKEGSLQVPLPLRFA